jgi:hypothetical protein
VDYVFKGDDDIMVVPENLLFQIKALQKSPTYTMTGCLKTDEPTNRNLESKYFTPIEIYKNDLLPKYFSGAGYLLAREAVFKLISVRSRVLLFPLDDVYFGQLIKMAGIANQETGNNIKIL